MSRILTDDHCFLLGIIKYMYLLPPPTPNLSGLDQLMHILLPIFKHCSCFKHLCFVFIHLPSWHNFSKWVHFTWHLCCSRSSTFWLHAAACVKSHLDGNQWTSQDVCVCGGGGGGYRWLGWGMLLDVRRAGANWLFNPLHAKEFVQFLHRRVSQKG